MASPWQTKVQATIRRLARSIASHNQTLRFLRPTNVHISSSSRTFHRFFWAFFRAQPR